VAVGWPLIAQVGGQVGEERPVHRHDSFSPALADHAHLSAPHVHLSQPQPAHLARAQAAEQHQQHLGPIAVGDQIGNKRLNLAQVQALRSR